jgi:uncharacterized C2H2 Zn-finger protein
MTTKFYCGSDGCTHADNGPFVLELPQEAVMDGNNMATIFCPRCAKPMRPLPAASEKAPNHHRFFCDNHGCNRNGKEPFCIDLPEEAVMDKNNLATIFCPRCGKAMKPFTHMVGHAVNS